jgi:hypothetical protein
VAAKAMFLASREPEFHSLNVIIDCYFEVRRFLIAAYFKSGIMKPQIGLQAA